jgi:hypothetical protein
MSKFQIIEVWFSELLTAAAPVLSNSEREEIQRFIDVGEYGLALETAVDIYADERKLASTAVIALVERLAEAMELEATPLLQRLPGGSSSHEN